MQHFRPPEIQLDFAFFFDQLKREVPKHPLPLAFDSSCKHCHKEMRRSNPVYLTTRKPFATFQCDTCKAQLLLFATTDTPLLVWSDTFRGAVDFSATIDHLENERNLKRRRRELREHAAHDPAAV